MRKTNIESDGKIAEREFGIVEKHEKCKLYICNISEGIL